MIGLGLSLQTVAVLQAITDVVRVPPAPVFTTQPSMTPTSATAGVTSITWNRGAADNTTSYAVRFLLNGNQIATPANPFIQQTAGSLVLEVTATGPGGSTVATSAAVTVAAAEVVNPAPTARAVWFDSDMEFDSDDSQAFGVMSGIAREDGWRIIGGSVSSFVPRSGAALRGLMNYHGVTSAPVGVNKDTARPSTTSPGRGVKSPWCAAVADMTGQALVTNDNQLEAVGVMRAAIAAEPRSDGVFLVTGGAGTLAAFLQSPADGVSPLTGSQLLAAKFSFVAILAGRPPGSTNAEYNIQSDRNAMDYVNVNCPIPIWWADASTTGQFLCGPPLDRDENLDPYRKALVAAKLANTGDVTAAGKRTAYDPAMVLWAMKGHSRLTFMETSNVINANASNTFTDGPNARGDRRITTTTTSSTGAVNTELDRLLGVAYTPNSPALLQNTRLWTPADYPAAKKLAWYDARDQTSVIRTGDAVTAWNDKFGLRNITAASAERQPVYSADGLAAGVPGITFTDDRLDGALSGLAPGDTLTFLALARNNGNVVNARIFSAARAGTGDFQTGGVFVNFTSATGTRIGVDGTFSSNSGSNPGAGVFVVAAHARKGESSLWYAGNETARPTVASDADFSTTTRFAIGSNVADNTENFNGVFAEIVILKNATQDDIEKFIGHATHRRSTAATLSGAAAYKAFPPRAV